MKPVSISFQKRILFIPGLNVLNFFIWFYNSFFYDKIRKSNWESMWIVFSSGAPFAALIVILSNCSPVLETWVSCLGGYIVPLLWGYRFIRLQEKIQAYAETRKNT